MSDNKERRILLDRAERMVKQSRVLRQLSDELFKESRDIRASAEKARPADGKSTKRKQR